MTPKVVRVEEYDLAALPDPSLLRGLSITGPPPTGLLTVSPVSKGAPEGERGQ
jgi:hypothetical protein